MKNKFLFVLLCATPLLAGACSPKLVVKSVGYQSLVCARPDYSSTVPSNAEISVYYFVDADGRLSVEVKNHTGDIMMIDRTHSYFINSDHSSSIFYDPTVQVNTTTKTHSGTTGATVNVGAVARAAGVGGALGTALSGVNVGKSNTNTTTNTNTVYVVDQPQASIPPGGVVDLGGNFRISAVGRGFLYEVDNQGGRDIVRRNTADFCFGVVVSYSLDGGETFDRVETSVYTNNLISCTVKERGKVNDALREVLTAAPDALIQPWYLVYANTVEAQNGNKMNTTANGTILKGFIIDYK